MSDISDQLERQCEIVDACEALDAAAARLRALSTSPHLLDLWRLPLITKACVVAAEAQAAALGAWCDEAAAQDALLARELRRSAEALGELACRMAYAAELAAGFAASESFEAAAA